MFFRQLAPCLVLLCLAAASAAVAADTDGNSFEMLKAAQAALAKGDAATAASLSNLAVLRNRADMYCFPPESRSDAEDGFQRGMAELDDRLKPITSGGPAVLERMVADAQAWTPNPDKLYDPGWKSASRCGDYPGIIKDLKAQMLPLMQRGATLLRAPEYQQAYLVFADVMQDYNAPPPESAYSAARIAALTAAIATMRRIETEKNLPYFGQMAGSSPMKPVPFHVLASGQAAQPIAYTDQADPALSNGITHIVGDAAALGRLWHSLYGEAASAPAVDFSKQAVIFASEARGRPISGSRMFISRIESEDAPFPGLMVYLRIPVWADTCFGHPATVYPYVVAVINRPEQLPPSAGFDMQNFPAPGCPPASP